MFVVRTPTTDKDLFVVGLRAGVFPAAHIALRDHRVVLFSVPVDVVFSRLVYVADVTRPGTLGCHDVRRQSSRNEDAVVGLCNGSGLHTLRTQRTDHLVA